MFPGRPSSYINPCNILIAFVFAAGISSCGTIVKSYPSRQPFVYQTNIHVKGSFSNEEREALASRLKGQLDDSMRARSVSKLLWSVMKNPPLYKNESADKSVLFMRALLSSLGYFRDSIKYDTTVQVAKTDQYRTTVDFDVTPGKQVKIDSFSYTIKHPELQSITMANQQGGLVKKGDPFAKASISLELDRLVDLYRNNGYLRFSRQELIGLWDTLDVSLLRPTMDPFEQLELFEKLRQRRENPTANLEIRLRPGYDTSKTRKFFVGNITVYPDYGPDSAGFPRRETIVDGVKIIDYRNMFKPKIIPQNIYFRRGDLYNQKKYFKTINRFNALNAWRLVNIESVPRKDEDTADFVIFLTPARKYSFTANIEATRNQNALSGNLFGIGFNIGLQNRNFARAANQANTNLRFGVELSDSSLIQTRQFSISHNIYFPRPIPNARWIPAKWVDNFRTVLSMNAAITERLNLFNLTTFNLSWGYEFQVAGKKPNTNYNFSLRLPNIEYSTLIPRQQLLDLFDENPALRNIFTDGLISSVILGMTRTSENKKNVNILRANMEVSGLVAGLIKNEFLDSNLYRYIKVDLDFARKITLNKSALVLHFFGGMGYAFESTVNKNKRNNLPFFKQYFAGGPNSMRAWGLRRLGQGSVVKAFTGAGSTPERYGDVQLEANIEYRFPLANIQGVKVFGAAFTDIGNVWFLKDAEGRDKREIFNFGRLGKDLAVGVGLGLRVDFSFFVIRFDYSYKAKDPSPSPGNSSVQNKWFGYKKWRDADQFQLGISYPFVL